MSDFVSISDAEILIVGVIRNCEAGLTKSCSVLAKAFSSARRVRWLIVESDSEDGTLNVLKSLSTQLRDFQFISLGRMRDALPKRTQRIAFARNAYVNLINEQEDYADVTFVVVADLDGVNDGLTQDAVMTCWERGGWDVCFANQDGPYYDIWALRHPLWSPNDCWAQADFLGHYDSQGFTWKQNSVYARMVRIPTSSPWIPVESAFGGLGLYKRWVFSRSAYLGTNEADVEVCEHVEFHKSLVASGARLFINPKLINAGYTEHSEPLRFWSTLRREIPSLIRNQLQYAFRRSAPGSSLSSFFRGARER